MIITIDGPAASGKSTVAQEIARCGNLFYINSGYLYRALSYELMRQQFPINEQLVALGIHELHKLIPLDELSYSYVDGAVTIVIHDRDITPYLKTPEVDRAASLLSLNQQVRNLVTAYQRTLAEGRDAIVEGRDAGTVVFPDAELKIFLTASVEERARRMVQDLQRKQITLSIEQAKSEIIARDERDEQRALAPLQVPKGAVIIDSTTLSLEQVVNVVTRLIEALR